MTTQKKGGPMHSISHLDAEQMAALAEGNITGTEHETCLEHLSHCPACLKEYTALLDYVEKEKQQHSPWWKITHVTLPGFLQAARNIKLPQFAAFTPRFYVPALAAAMAIIILLVPVILIELHHQAVLKQKIGYTAAMVQDIENSANYLISDTHNKITAAVRTGIFIEDIYFLAGIKDESKLLNDVVSLLDGALWEFLPGKMSLGKIRLDHLYKHLDRIVKEWETPPTPLHELFHFGRFLELSSLDTFAGKLPHVSDIEKYQEVAKKYQLPQGVHKGMERLSRIIAQAGPAGKTAHRPSLKMLEECRETCSNIKKIFLLAE